MKVKVISLPYIFQVLYVLCFSRPKNQVRVYRTIGPLVDSARLCMISQIIVIMFMINQGMSVFRCQDFFLSLSDNDVAFFFFLHQGLSNLIKRDKKATFNETFCWHLLDSCILNYLINLFTITYSDKQFLAK